MGVHSSHGGIRCGHVRVGFHLVRSLCGRSWQGGWGQQQSQQVCDGVLLDHAPNCQRRLVHLSLGLFLRLLDGGCQRQCLESRVQPCGLREQDCILLGYLAIGREQHCCPWGAFGVKKSTSGLIQRHASVGVCVVLAIFVFFSNIYEKVCLRTVFANTLACWPHVPATLSHDDISPCESNKRCQICQSMLACDRS